MTSERMRDTTIGRLRNETAWFDGALRAHHLGHHTPMSIVDILQKLVNESNGDPLR